MVSARLLGNARQRDRRGGIRGWNSVRDDILNHLKEDPGCLVTTMVDYYALPQSGDTSVARARAAGRTAPFPQRLQRCRVRLLADIQSAMGERFNPARFVPYVMMHEFEGLLFSDP